MEEFIKKYEVKIKALSPIHVGNGEKIGKKEYINLLWNHKVIIPDLAKMYADICKVGLEREYINYMLNERIDLGVWLKQHDFQKKDYECWKKYEMDSGDALSGSSMGRQVRPKEIMCITKDAYGLPYIPGSSLKGMIRTALLAYEIKQNPGKYREVCTRIRNNVKQYAKRDQCLARETADLEVIAFYTLGRDEKKRGNAVNSCLAGVIVSDSKPISLENLILSQKIDYTLEGKEKPLPILKEALIPGTEINFEISIDRTQCEYTIDDILTALEDFQQNVYKNYYSRFRRGSEEKGIVWLGGGSGFLSKTIIYPVFEKDAVRISDAIFKNTLGKNYSIHKHNKDISLRIAPHVCKCTYYNGRLYDMGMGKIEVLSK